ncbi:MAG: hypothetical protein QOE06_1296 [Thermoleophilaceae bacterium]|nr:hypothetical protein [Thermoleophilaceae bacterium]
MPDAALAAPRERHLDDGLFLACALAWGASLIHVEAAIEHLREWPLYSVFFASLATVQLLWGVVLYRSPGRRLLIAGAAASILVAALWFVTRTSGLPFGPESGIREHVGGLDLAATGDELALALLVTFHLRPTRGGLLARGLRQLAIAAGLGLLLLSSLILMLAGDPH